MRYLAPTSLDDAVNLLNTDPGDIRVLAGGTDLLVRMRSGFVPLTQTGEGPFKDYPCFFISCVVADANEGADRLRRRAGAVPAKDNELKALTPKTVAEVAPWARLIVPALRV